MFAVDFKNEEEVKEYLKRIGTEYSYHCYQEKSGDGCYRLGSFLAGVRQDFSQACQAFEKGCDSFGHADSCTKIGAFYASGKGVDKDIEKAKKYFTMGCEQDSPESCYGLGIILAKKDKDTNKVEAQKAFATLQKGCDLKNKDSCFKLSSLYFQGLGDVPQDLTKSFQFSEKSCELGHMFGCSNLSVMYKKGRGTEKNEELAKKFRAKAEEIRKEWTENKPHMTFGQT